MNSRIMIEQCRPVEGKEIVVPNMDWFIFAMNRAFGMFPCELDSHHIAKLEGMAAVWQGPSMLNPFDAIIRQIKKVGAIRVWQMYDGDTPPKIEEENDDSSDSDGQVQDR